MPPSLLLLLTFACDDGYADPTREFAPAVADGPLHAETVARPLTHGVVDTPLTDVHGTPIGVACATCHGPSPDTAWAATPGEPFHTGVALRHGELTCGSCHDDARLGLRLADGTALELGDSMRLCGQCHGGKLRDFRRGAHGGMTGYWDLRQGPRTRSHCVACHAPHTPAYEPVRPVHPPKDRYLLPASGEEH